MATESKIRSLCRVLLLAASIGALSAGTAFAQENSDLSDLNNQILNDPGNAGLNLRYAHAAEAAGKLRLALAAYERVLINDSENAEARAGYERVRRAIEPDFTVARVEVGVATDSNPFNFRDNIFNVDPTSIWFGRAVVAHEQNFLGTRWRSNLNFEVNSYTQDEELNYVYIGAQTGPVLAVAPHMAVLPSIGVSHAWLGGDDYYNEANATLAVEGRTGDISYWAHVRYGRREFNEREFHFFPPTPVSDNGGYVELIGGFAKPHLLSNRDTLVVSPFARWSDISSIFSFGGDDFSPGKYDEYGVDAAYNYQLTDHIQGSVGVVWRERKFDEVFGFQRDDKHLAPRVSLTYQGLFQHNMDLKLQYEHRDNDSNDYLSNYDGERVSLSLITRF